MEVTRKNFDAVLSSLEKVFQKAQFIAVDTEYTGLKVDGESSINYFDTLEDLYLRYRLKAETFMAIQIGLVAFFYDDKTNKSRHNCYLIGLSNIEAEIMKSAREIKGSMCIHLLLSEHIQDAFTRILSCMSDLNCCKYVKEYSHLGYNFYVYPSSYSNINFSCQSTSIQFLVEHGFDFNKLFKEGIPYLKEEEVEKLLEKLKEKYEKNYNADNSKKLEIPIAQKVVVDDIVSRIESIISCNKKETFTTEKFNNYYRRLIYSSVQQNFGSSVLIESNKDESMTISVGFSTEELKEKQKDRFLKQKNDILEEIGFSKVIKLLIESKKLLIGHNLFMDILFIIRQFLVPLPDNYNEIKDLVKFIFPQIIDTKHMAGAKLPDLKNTSLNCLVEYFENSKSFQEVLVHENGMGYNVQDKKLHEASYDAFLTGLCFLALSEHLGKVSGISNIFKNLPESAVLQDVLNKLSTPKLHDISYMNLGGLDNEPDRLGVYHLTFPVEWTRENINDLFKDYGAIYISWINNMSAFIKVKREYINEIEKNFLNSSQNYKLLTYKKFKSLNSASSDQLLSPLLEKRLGSVKNTFGNDDSPFKTGSDDFVKKRKAEDIGEVIERPQKKICSN